MPKRKSLQEMWEEFETQGGVPVRAGPGQRTDMRVCFYSGAVFLFHSVLEGLSEGQEPMQADMEYISGLSEEMVEFSKRLKLADPFKPMHPRAGHH